MSDVGKHSGQHEPEMHIPHARKMLALAGGVTATLVAWGFLVVAAVDLAGKARDGQGVAWLFVFLATLGATACMFLTMILGNKLRLLMKGEEQVVVTRIPGGRRARK
ncbi:hypothetical protein ABIE44_002724 [Marmoricola sp. OAE513]